ncbi:hypothetical protein FFY77_02000 [Xanthomonas translucens pv. translucens]|nr:hypothetical protein [Xanthomonas translucens pv. translucens]
MGGSVDCAPPLSGASPLFAALRAGMPHLEWRVPAAADAARCRAACSMAASPMPTASAAICAGHPMRCVQGDLPRVLAARRRLPQRPVEAGPVAAAGSAR